MLAWGGPSLPALRDALAGAVSAATSGRAAPGSLGELFAALGDDLHRPVEVFGLLHLAANSTGLVEDEAATEEYHTVRPDGTTRTLRVARITVDAATSELEEQP